MRAERTFSTICPFCGVGCTLELHLRGDQIIRATSLYDSPVNHGNLCVKGRFGWDFTYNPKRITAPRIRRNGKLTAATWDEALDLVADKFVEIYRRHGGDALAAFLCAKATNEDNFVAQK